MREFGKDENISHSMLSRWLADKENILRRALEGCTKKKNRVNVTSKHSQTSRLLYGEFCKQRDRGKKISFLWFLVTGRKIAREKGFPYYTNFAAQDFIKDYQIKLRKVQYKKQKPKSCKTEVVTEWHLNFRETCIKSKNTSSNYTEQWGRFPPDRRFNMDQVPLPFVLDSSTTYERGSVGRYDKVHVSHPGSGLEKRQCTLQCCFSGLQNISAF